MSRRVGSFRGDAHRPSFADGLYGAQSRNRSGVAGQSRAGQSAEPDAERRHFSDAGEAGADRAGRSTELMVCLPVTASGLRAGNFAEHRIARLARITWIVVEEQTHHVAGRIEPADRLAGRAEHLGLGVDLEA